MLSLYVVVPLSKVAIRVKSVVLAPNLYRRILSTAILVDTSKPDKSTLSSAAKTSSAEKADGLLSTPSELS